MDSATANADGNLRDDQGDRMTEFAQKQNRIQRLLEEHRLDALLLQRVNSFAWATC